jgi:hypothetical protein
MNEQARVRHKSSSYITVYSIPNYVTPNPAERCQSGSERADGKCKPCQRVRERKEKFLKHKQVGREFSLSCHQNHAITLQCKEQTFHYVSLSLSLASVFGGARGGRKEKFEEKTFLFLNNYKRSILLLHDSAFSSPPSSSSSPFPYLSTCCSLLVLPLMPYSCKKKVDVVFSIKNG